VQGSEDAHAERVRIRVAVEEAGFDHLGDACLEVATPPFHLAGHGGGVRRI
jgi:hypothetical protein